MSTIGTTLKQPRVFAHDAIALSGLDYPINTIATLTIVNGGSNYTAGIVDSTAIIGGGSGAEVTIVVGAGIVTGATIVGAYDGGINYQVGDQITLSQSGSDENCILQVATIVATTPWALGDPITPMPSNFSTVSYWNEKMAYTYTSTAQPGVVKETPGPGAALYIGAAMDITVINEATTEVEYKGVAAGSFLPVSVLSVVAQSAGTLDDILVLF